MPRAVKAINGWSAGEWSPRLGARSDLPQYTRSLRTCQNFVVTPEGALVRRPPTRALGAAKTTEGVIRLIPFVPDETHSYVLEFGHLYVRVWAASGQVMEHGNPLELVTPYTAADLADLSTAQSADVMYIVHPRHLPRQFSRTSLAPTFSLTSVAFANGRAPLDVQNITPTTLTLSGTWPSALTVTASAATFVSFDVGRVFYIQHAAQKRGAYVTLTSVSSPTVAAATGNLLLGDGIMPGGSDRWSKGLFSAGRGCRAVGFHESRLWYGGFMDAPDTVVGSVSNAFDMFETISPDPAVSDSANADRAITRRMGAGKVERVLWMASGTDVLFVGTGSGEFVIAPGVTGILTPLEASVRRATTRGSEPGIAPERVDGTAFFVQRGGQRLRRVKYDIETDNFVTEDATVLCSHMAVAGISALVYQQTPFSVLWFLDRRDNLYGLTLEGQQDVIGAHRHVLGGALDGRPPRVQSIAVVPSGMPGRADVLFLLVLRRRGGALTRTVETLAAGTDLLDLLDARLPPERLVYALERLPCVDGFVPLGQTWAISGGGDVSNVLRFEHAGTGPSVGQTVVLRGLAWRSGQQVVSRTAGTRIPYVVPATGTGWFEIALPAAPSVSLRPADLGLPAGVRVFVDVDALPPRADLQLTTITVPPVSQGDGHAVIADGRVEGTTLSAPASLVVSGYPYRSEFETSYIHLQGGIPADIGEPARVSRVTVWMWGGVDAFVSVGEGPAQRVVAATTEDMMGSLPSPLFVPVTVDVDSDPREVATVKVFTDSPVTADIIGLTLVVRTNPR